MTEPNYDLVRGDGGRCTGASGAHHDLDVDVCVIGAGLAGLTVAREVARRGWSVAVLDAGEVAGGASGRNAGFVSPGFAERIDAIVDRVGLPRAKELWALSFPASTTSAARSARPVCPASSRAMAACRSGAPTMSRDCSSMPRCCASISVRTSRRGRPIRCARCCAARYYFQGIHFAQAFHIHPLNYALGLAADAEKHGARIFQNTQATAIDPAGVRKRVQTPADWCGHGMSCSPAAPSSADRWRSLRPCCRSRPMGMTAKPLGEKLFEAVRYSGAVGDTRPRRRLLSYRR